VSGRHLPPDRDAGDEFTLGGYAAVHGRPAAFEGPDGLPYSVEIETDTTGDPAQPFGAFLLFLRWRRMGPPGIDAHIETGFLAFADSADAARRQLGAMSLHDAKEHLDRLVRLAGDAGGRAWRNVMRDETGGE
jgi:hypothetical protein